MDKVQVRYTKPLQQGVLQIFVRLQVAMLCFTHWACRKEKSKHCNHRHDEHHCIAAEAEVHDNVLASSAADDRQY